MFSGAHFLLYSKEPEADRAFLREVLNFPAVDAGGGWLIFRLPPAELAVHPTMGAGFEQLHAEHPLLGCVLYLMCDDLDIAVRALQAKKVKCSKVEKAEWGTKTTFKLPSGGEIGLYQPAHPTALYLPA
jgi:glyoxalase/bleomycin resistance protein/dioxygenase superfamily protein